MSVEPLSKYDAIVDVQAIGAHKCYMPPEFIPGGHWFGLEFLIVPDYKNEKNQREARQLQRRAKDL